MTVPSTTDAPKGWDPALPDRIAALPIPPGPWMQDQWHVRGDKRRSSRGTCAVHECGRNVYFVGREPNDADQAGKTSLCYAHYFQWWRAGSQTVPVADWLAQGGPEPVGAQRGRPSASVINFAAMPPVIAHEIRFVVGTKISRGDWTPNRPLRKFLLTLCAAARADTRVWSSETLTSRSGDEWLLAIRQYWLPTKGFDNVCAPYVRTFFRLLEGAADPDPWRDDRWDWRDKFEFVVPPSGPGDRASYYPLDWSGIGPDWLRNALKQHARHQLTTSRMAWTTLPTWIRAARLFSEYITAVGVSTPQDVTRSLFLDYLEWVRRTRGGRRTSLVSVNTMAGLLEALHDTDRLPDLGSQGFLRRGENALTKARNPRPFPPDVIDRVDRLILTDQSVDPTVRAMLATTRWAGCRASELVALPIDCLRHGSGGYWIEYWMTKTQSWRRFPIPESLAELLLAQQRRVRGAYGDSAEHLFPGCRSNASAGLTRPWSTSGLRHHLSTLFDAAGITSSAVTGEPISGGDVHRFRHTVGMTLLNNGWTQQEVRDFLGHASETMTSTYARITDDTLAKKARAFWAAQEQQSGDIDPGVERLRGKFVAALPNGFCTLPVNQTCDFRPNPCLDCSFHDPSGRVFLGSHIAHRDQLRGIIADARASGQQQIIALNQPMLDKVDKIITELESEAGAAAEQENNDD
jgi:integrase